MYNDFDFLTLNEPYSYDNSIISIPLNYTIAAANNSPQAAIIFKSTHNAQLLFCNEEVVVVQIEFHHQEANLASTYCSPSKNMESNMDILKSPLLRFEELPFIILGDFNAKFRIWGQRDLDHRGSTLLSVCHLMDLTIENNPDSPPSYSSSRGDSCVDLLLTKNLSDNISMEVREEMLNSDHNMLYIEYSLHNTELHFTNKINIKTRLAEN
ncbi:hypothetical protein CDAR_312671 [Caerostris darwini]|uniref:Endonuclease/exonuclease/phosphatase domain-containing protein n=1 Tax=Caerostris darwini TaxID=1538125 RepID=A0AAV4MEP0_9ARAC|nr:hypothetical protein CDAR_312671 [Caerostris darwini]